jgi:hypothetical protein
VAAFRPQIEAAAKTAGVSADWLEGLVFLESAGRPDVIAPQGITGAVGLTQIVASTGTGLLAMPIDVARSARLTTRIATARTPKVARRLIAERKRADPRFDVAKTLAASGRYLALAEKEFGSEELAFVSYHMGIGNLQGVLDAYAGGPTKAPLAYAQVYFDSSPTRHSGAWRRLFALGDDSSRYIWKLRAAMNIMAAYRADPADLAAAAALQTEKNSAEEVLHPSGSTPVYVDPEAIQQAYDTGELVPLPVDVRRTGIGLDRRLGRQAVRLKQPRRLYRGLRPEALATLLYIGAEVRAGAGDDRSFLTVTSAVRDQRYQARLLRTNPQATANYSLHTTGYAFDILRRYRSDRQARAFQAVLDRLQSLNLIAYVYEPQAIHVTVSTEGSVFKPLLDRVAVEPGA